MDITQGLNEQQKQAVLAPDGQVLVVAGAGSGKTRVLVSRVIYLLQEKRVSPYEIMAVTFTNKAAREMKERLENMTGQSTRWMWIGTFHALCARFLRMEGQYLAPRTADFTIYDDGDTRSVIKKCLSELGLSDDKQFTVQAVRGAISDAKNNMKGPEALAAEAADFWQETVAKVYRSYQTRLRDNNAVDFDDLLRFTVELLKQYPELLARYRERFRYILVDEYQDTNHCQYELVRLLTGEKGNLFVVGDPDQSIYRWRGADISNIMDFSEDYPGCLEVKLVENYRSTQQILDASNALIAHNQNRKPKELFTSQEGGDKIRLHYAADDRDEAYFVVDNVMRLRDEGYNYQDCAVLYRTHSQSRALEDQCRRFQIPYRIYGGIKFYERKEVKDTLAYLRFLSNQRDTEALNRIYNEPKRGIGATTWNKLLLASAQQNLSAYELLAEPQRIGDLSAATARKLHNLYEFFAGLVSFAETASMKDVLERLWRDSGYRDMLLGNPDTEERQEVLEELFNIASLFDEEYQEALADGAEEQMSPLTAFLGQMALATDMDNTGEENDFLTLMTMHAAKGLEFPVVFITGLSEGLFPHQRAIFDLQEEQMEEERRLCYVGMTRAKEKLYLTMAQERLNRGMKERCRPSRFLNEVPAENLDKSGLVPTKREEEQQLQSRQAGSGSLFAPRPKRGPVQAPAKAAMATVGIKLGDRVMHAKFGEGMVVAVSGSGDDAEVSVAFPSQGVKKLLWRYAPLEKI